MTTEQQDKVLQLLRQAWTTVDYFDHNGELSTEIQDFLRQLGRPIVMRETNKEKK